LAPLDVPADPLPGLRSGHAGVIDEFIHCVREGGVPQTAASDNIKSLAMVLSAIESAARHRPVEIVI
ncbi:MAG: gfo/Idh/MocA family oxidoreductase, partial [Anaerolineales bacterium]